ncbi:MAG: hypothetical protein LBL71_00565 [Endomicrobium sp.]|nr:hypothetical protein [Endomicrobium sp.]
MKKKLMLGFMLVGLVIGPAVKSYASFRWDIVDKGISFITKKPVGGFLAFLGVVKLLSILGGFGVWALRGVVFLFSAALLSEYFGWHPDFFGGRIGAVSVSYM